MTLNSEGLEKAREAVGTIPGAALWNAVETAISAYLAALPPVDGLEVVGLKEANEALMREWTNMIETKREQIERLTKERDEMVEAANSYAHQAAKSEIALRDAEARISSLEEENKRLREIAKAVAHIGVDFGYGPYEVEDRFIEEARKLLEEHNG